MVIMDRQIIIFRLRSGEEKAQFVIAFPNTNLFYNLTGIPTLIKELQPGHHILIHAVYGAKIWKGETAQVTLDGNQVVIRLGNTEKTVVCPEEWLS